MRRNRKQNRKDGFDYTSEGYYFVTICVKDRVQCLGYIKHGRMCVNRFGTIIWWQWKWLERQYPFVRLHQFVVMPNHVHGVVEICRPTIRPTVGTGLDLSLRLTSGGLGERSSPQRFDEPVVEQKPLSLSNIIGALKTTSSKLIHEYGLPQFKWQRSFYDVIIRDPRALYGIERYIRENPMKWWRDRNNEEGIFI